MASLLNTNTVTTENRLINNVYAEVAGTRNVKISERCIGMRTFFVIFFCDDIYKATDSRNTKERKRERSYCIIVLPSIVSSVKSSVPGSWNGNNRQPNTALL